MCDANRNARRARRVRGRMRSIVYSRTGDSSVLSLVERDPADPGPGEVRVRVEVSGVNPTDWKARAGGGAAPSSDEVVPNQDGAGIVDAVGDGCDGAQGRRSRVGLPRAARPPHGHRAGVHGRPCRAGRATPRRHRLRRRREPGRARDDRAPRAHRARVRSRPAGAGRSRRPRGARRRWRRGRGTRRDPAGAPGRARPSSRRCRARRRRPSRRAAGAHHVVDYTRRRRRRRRSRRSPRTASTTSSRCRSRQNAALDGE